MNYNVLVLAFKNRDIKGIEDQKHLQSFIDHPSWKIKVTLIGQQ